MEEVKRIIFRDRSLGKKFLKDGFVTVPFLNENEIKELQAVYHALKENHFTAGFYSTMMMPDFAYRRNVDEKLKNKLAARINEFLNGYKILFGNFIVKEPDANSSVGVHQDWTYTNEEVFTAVNFWIPLTEINELNGPLHILRGSHLLPTSIRYTPYENPLWAQHFDTIKSLADPCEVKTGEAVLYHPAAIHFSPPNVSSDSRVAVGLVTCPKEAVPLHYFKDPASTSEVLEMYEVNPEFFHEIEIGSRPQKFAQLIEKIPFDRLSFSEEQLQQKQKEMKNSGSIIKRIQNIFSNGWR